MTWAQRNGGKARTFAPEYGADRLARSVSELASLPNGAVLRFSVPGGLTITASKTNARRWLVHGGGVDTGALAGLPAVPMRRVS